MSASAQLHLLQQLLSGPDCISFRLLLLNPPTAIRTAIFAELMLPDCIDPLQLLLTACVRFSGCFPTVCASTASRLHPLRLLLPNCVRFNCCSPIVSACSTSCSIFSNILCEVQGSVRRMRITSLVLPYKHPTSITHTHTHTHN